MQKKIHRALKTAIGHAGWVASLEMLPTKFPLGGFRADDDAVFVTGGNPFAPAGVWPEPRDYRRLRHHREVERAGVAAKVQRAVPDDGGDLREIQIPVENTPRLLRKQREQPRHFFLLALGRRAGQRQLFFRKTFSQCGDEFRELFRRQFLVIGGRERADMKIRSGVGFGKFPPRADFQRGFRCEIPAA